MRAKRHALVGDFAKFVQAENLEAAGISQDRPRPGHESVQASEVADGLDSRPQIEVISIAEKNLDPEFFENILRDGFDRGGGAYGHKHGSFDLSMGRDQATSAGRAGAVPDYELNGHCLRL